MKPTLIIMAAGIGSRYGGLKQIDPIGPNGEIIMDYSIYDAIKAGFGKIVFVIKKEMEESFRESIGKRIDKITDTAYVFQSLDDVPKGFKVPAERKKPWGTGHAVLCCRNAVDTPFAVVNSDDFYGYESYKVLSEYLQSIPDDENPSKYGMVGFILENTLTENGYVARGICSVNGEGFLTSITERTRIEKSGALIKFTEDGEHWFNLPRENIVSMNMWGFSPGIFKELERGFSGFLEKHGDNPEKMEFFLPEVVDGLISKGRAMVRVLSSHERWYGVTYQQDKEMVKEAVRKMISQGLYPENLWGL